MTNDDISKLKKRNTKLRKWIKVLSFLYKKTLKTSLLDKEIDEEEAEDLKQIKIPILIRGKILWNQHLLESKTYSMII